MITSSSNNLVKLVTSLHHKKGRLEHNLYLAEGVHLVQEAIKANASIQYIFWSAKLASVHEGANLLANLPIQGEVFEVSDLLFAKLSETENPQGILTVIKTPPETVLDLAQVKFGLIVDGLQDPGNVGTIIRTAWALKLDCLIFTPGAADPYQGKVVRASQGGVFHGKIYRNISPAEISQLANKQGVQLVAGDPKATVASFECDLLPPTLILIGNEGRGLATEWENFLVKMVYIPQPGKAESLNAAVSAGILMYEAIRQHSMRGTCKM